MKRRRKIKCLCAIFHTGQTPIGCSGPEILHGATVVIVGGVKGGVINRRLALIGI